MVDWLRLSCFNQMIRVEKGKEQLCREETWSFAEVRGWRWSRAEEAKIKID